MPSVLDQVREHFDGLGWRYHLDEDSRALLTRFRTPHGSIRLVLRPLSENDLLVEALNVETIGAEFSSAVATLAWQVMAVNVARDPSDGEARVRLWLPAEAGVVGRTSLQAAMDAVATSAGLVRARGKMGHCPNCSSGCRAFGSR